MWLTHFSPAMPNPEAFVQVAHKIFPNSHVGYDRKMAMLSFEGD